MRRTRGFSLASTLAALAVLLLPAGLPAPAQAQQISLIRDAETESIIRTYATPLFQAAGLSPSAIKVYLVRDPSLNAFVTTGLRMFIHTGLLMRAEDPLEVIGVIAHETGHLAAGHTVTRQDAVRSATTTALASTILGFAAALATGRGEFASAAVRGGQDIAVKGLLSYTRGQEAAADQYAVDLLNGTGQSPRGLLNFMRVLGGQEVLFGSQQDPYLRTHPITAQRIAFLENQVARSPYGDKPADPRLVALHERMLAKLTGFLEPPPRTFERYPESDTSLPARYARAIAHFQAGDIERALALLDALIAEHPEDPYFRELRGQILLENGRVAEAVPDYEAATALLPESGQLHLLAAHARLETNDPEEVEPALEHLAVALREESGNAFAWRLSAIAHGRRGDVGMTALSLAEGAIVRGEPEEALGQAKRAQSILAEDSPAWLRARDLEDLAQRRVDKKNRQ